MNKEERERQREYNRKYAEKHPDYVNEWVKKKYRENEEYRERTKFLQKKNYYKRMGYNYEVQILPINVFDTNADEVKLIRNGNSWIVEIKTRIERR